MEEKGITDFIECGPSKVLTGLNKRITKTDQCFDTSTVENFTNLIKKFKIKH